MSDDREEAYKKLLVALAELNRVRGDFLAAMIDLEAHIDRAILFFFAPDELRLFIDCIFDRLNFSAKLNALRAILRAVGLADKHRDFLKEVEELRRERNEFAHVAFEFVGNSYMSHGGNYELYRKERLDPGPRVSDIIHLSDLKGLIRRAKEAEKRAMMIEREITEAHDSPEEYFHRPGWDPRHRFS